MIILVNETRAYFFQKKKKKKKIGKKTVLLKIKVICTPKDSQFYVEKDVHVNRPHSVTFRVQLMRLEGLVTYLFLKDFRNAFTKTPSLI